MVVWRTCHLLLVELLQMPAATWAAGHLPSAIWNFHPSAMPNRGESMRGCLPLLQASADNILTTAFWIFYECHTIGFTGLSLFSPMSLWLAMMIIPWWESSVFSGANDASETATNRRVTLLLTSASCKILLASKNVEILALLILLWRYPKRLHKSGRVLVAAYWRDPTKARSPWRSVSFTGSLGVSLRAFGMKIGWMPLTYCSWLTQIE